MSSLVMSAKDQSAKPFQLWRVTYPNGVSRQITSDPDDYMGASVSGQTIVSVRVQQNWELFVAKAQIILNRAVEFLLVSVQVTALPGQVVKRLCLHQWPKIT